MPPQETTSTSGGRSSAFTSGLGSEVKVNEKDILKSYAQAAPGAIKDAVVNEYRHATQNPGRQLQRTGGHIFNVVSDTLGMVANAGSAAGNALATEGQHKLSDVGAALTNFASASMTGRSAGAKGNASYRDVNPIPEVKMPKLDTTPGNKVWKGGDAEYRPKVGTAASLGAHVPGDPFTTVDRGLNLLGTATLPVNGLGMAVKGVNTATRAAGQSAVGQATIAGAKRGAQFAGEKVAPAAVATSLMLSPILHQSPAAARGASISATVDAIDAARVGLPDGASSKIKAPEKPSAADAVAPTKADVIDPAKFDDVKERKAIRQAIVSKSRVDNDAKVRDEDTPPKRKDTDTKKKPKLNGSSEFDMTHSGQNVKLQRVN